MKDESSAQKFLDHIASLSKPVIIAHPDIADKIQSKLDEICSEPWIFVQVVATPYIPKDIICLMEDPD